MNKYLVAWVSGLCLLFFAAAKVLGIVAWMARGEVRDINAPIRVEQLIALVAELLVGLALIVPRARLVGAGFAILLGIAFCAYLSIRGPSARPCGCLGPIPLSYREELVLAIAVLLGGMVNLMLFSPSDTARNAAAVSK